MSEQKYRSATDLAGLPGMPKSHSAVVRLAKRKSWASRARYGRGGGREYAIESLPAETQTALAQRELQRIQQRGRSTSEHGSTLAVAGETPDARSNTLAVLFDVKPKKLKDQAAARLAVVQAFEQLVDRGIDRRAALGAVCRKHYLSVATLQRYLQMCREQPAHLWLFLLAPNYAGRTAKADLSAEAWEIIKADYLRRERPTISSCIARLRKAARAHAEWKVPSNRTIVRRLTTLPRAVRTLAREGSAALKRLYPAQQRSRAALAALSIVNGDGYKHNVWVRFADGDIVRAKTWFWQDVYSSKILAWRTDKTEHTDMIRLAFGDLVEQWGIPDAVLLDNTLAAANKTMSGGVRTRFRFKVREEEPDGVFKLLDVKVHWATPGHGQAKPIERAFGHGGVGEYVDKAPDFSGAWTGGNPLDKPEYDGKTRAIDLADLQQVIAREVASWNARAGRRGAIARGRSFDAVFDESYAVTPIRRATDVQRRLWLLATEPVRVSRDGTITLDAGRIVGERLANRYFSPQLIEHPGARVVARFDPQRMHQGVHVYTLDGRYLFFADCDLPAGFNDQLAGRERNRARNTFVRSVKALRTAETRMDALEAAKALSSEGRGTIPAPAAPARRVVRGEFRDPLERPFRMPAPLSDADRQYMARLEAEDAAPRAVQIHELRSDHDKDAHWKKLAARRAAGEALADQEEAFWHAWQQDPYFRIRRDGDKETEELLARRSSA